MKIFKKEQFYCRIFIIMALAVFGFLFHYSLELTGTNPVSYDEHIVFRQESILVNAFKLVGAGIVLYFFGKTERFFRTRRRRNILVGVCCVISLMIALYWVLNSSVAPDADQKIVVGFADLFNDGNFYGLERGKYIANYPQQIGIVTFLRLLFHIFGEGNYVSFQIFSALMVPVLVLAGCMVTRHLSDDNCKAELYYLLLVTTCFPMYAYTTFVYGDLVGVPFLLLAVWAVLSCMQKFRVWKLFAMGICAGIAVMFRTHLVIAVVAIMIVLVIKLLTKKDWHMIAIAAAVLAGTVLFLTVPKAMYSSVWEDDAYAIPTICYIVMGLNDDNGYPGWYNIYEWGTFAVNDYDPEKAAATSWSHLMMYIDIYREDPEYMIDFFTRKANAQWNAPMFQSIFMNNRIVGEQSAIIENILDGGKIAGILEGYMKIYQLIFYGGVVLFLTRKWNSGDGIEKYVLLIAVFGGFLFSLIFEAKTRYILPSFLIAIPAIALGVDEITSCIGRILSGIKKNREKTAGEQ